MIKTPVKASPFLSTRTFYESGYDSVAWVSKKNQEDSFYFDLLDLCGVSFTNLKTEICQAFVKLQEKKGPLTLIDDQSIVARAVKSLPEASGRPQVIELQSFRNWDLSFVETCSSEYGIQDPKILAFLQISQDLGKPVIWPQGYLRVLNVSYLRSTATHYGKPYWVYIENERVHRTAMACQALGLEVVENILKISPQVLKAYFLNFESTWNLSEFPEPHNDRLERYFWKEAFGTNGDLYSSLSVPELKMQMVEESRMQQAAFPLKSFYQSYLGQSASFNSLEQVFGTSQAK